MFTSLNLDQLKRTVPSIFTDGRAERTSDRYQQISTAQIVGALGSKGYAPTWAEQCRTRIVSKREYTKHMIRFRHVDAKATASGLYPEIVLINSHDGLSSYRLLSGVFRIVCSNGLVAGSKYDEVRVRHQGDIVKDVIDGTHTVINNSLKMIESANEMAEIQLNEKESLYLAEAALAVRFGDEEQGKAFDSADFLMPRRYVDSDSNDLFTKINILQENIIRGGIRGCVRNDLGRITKRTQTRAITSIDQSTKLNRALWTLAEKMMELKN